MKEAFEIKLVQEKLSFVVVQEVDQFAAKSTSIIWFWTTSLDTNLNWIMFDLLAYVVSKRFINVAISIVWLSKNFDLPFLLFLHSLSALTKNWVRDVLIDLLVSSCSALSDGKFSRHSVMSNLFLMNFSIAGGEISQ